MDNPTDELLAAMYSEDINGLELVCSKYPDIVNQKITTCGGCALQMACEDEFIEGVQYLLSIGVSPMQSSEIKHDYPLHGAARSGNEDIFQMIWNAGDCSKALRKECRPLFSALEGGNEEIISFFINHGVDPRWEYADSPKTGEEWCLMNGKHGLLDVLFTDRK